MRPAQLRHRIVIQEKMSVTDEYGGQVSGWNDYAEIWAKAAPIRGRELMAASAEHHEATIRFYTRFVPGVVPSMRIIWQGRHHDIVSVIDVNGRGVELEILTKTGANEG